MHLLSIIICNTRLNKNIYQIFRLFLNVILGMERNLIKFSFLEHLGEGHSGCSIFEFGEYACRKMQNLLREKKSYLDQGLLDKNEALESALRKVGCLVAGLS